MYGIAACKCPVQLLCDDGSRRCEQLAHIHQYIVQCLVSVLLVLAQTLLPETSSGTSDEPVGQTVYQFNEVLDILVYEVCVHIL